MMDLDRLKRSEGAEYYGQDGASQVHDKRKGEEEEGEEEDDMLVESRNGKFVGSSFNLASAAIGLGILSLPSTVHDSGLLLGSILFFIMALITAYSLKVIVDSAALCGKLTYQDTLQEAFGPGVSTFMGVVLMWNSSASTIASFIIIADSINQTFENDDSIYTSKNFVILLSFIVVFPLCVLRTMNALRHASAGAVTAFLYLAGLVFVMLFVQGKTQHHLVLVNDDLRVARSIPVIIYAYSCHSQCLPVYAELKTRTSKAMGHVIWGGVGLSFVLYATVGIFGYLTFGADVKTNILLNYGNAPHILIGRFMICAALILGYPMSSWVIRNSFEQIYFYVKEKGNMFRQLEEEGAVKTERRVSFLMNLVETTVILVISVGLAVVIPDIRTIFGIVGSTGTVTVNFIVPGLMYIKLLKRRMIENKGIVFVDRKIYTHVKLRMWCAALLVVMGVVVGVLGTAMTIYYL